jgi:hypothetical protein
MQKGAVKQQKFRLRNGKDWLPLINLLTPGSDYAVIIRCSRCFFNTCPTSCVSTNENRRREFLDFNVVTICDRLLFFSLDLVLFGGACPALPTTMRQYSICPNCGNLRSLGLIHLLLLSNYIRQSVLESLHLVCLALAVSRAI